MIIKATQKNTRQTPRKVRLVANTIKDLPLEQAIKQLAVIERRATLVVLKTLKQAIANAMNNHNYAFEDLSLKNILVEEGPRYKRFRAVSRGRAHGLIKRTCHVTVELEAGNSKQSAVSSKQEDTKPVTVKLEDKKKVEKLNSSKVEKKETKKQSSKSTAKKTVKKSTKKVTKKIDK